MKRTFFTLVNWHSINWLYLICENLPTCVYFNMNALFFSFASVGDVVVDSFTDKHGDFVALNICQPILKVLIMHWFVGSICAHIQLYYVSKETIFFTTNLVNTYIKWLIYVTFYTFMNKVKKDLISRILTWYIYAIY